MRVLRITSIALLVVACATRPAPLPEPPATEARHVSETLHGVEIIDPYQWLEEQDSPPTREWISRQNAYTDAVLGSRPEPALFTPRLHQLMSTDDVKTPAFKNGR